MRPGMRTLLAICALVAPVAALAFPVAVSTRGSDGLRGRPVFLEPGALPLENRELADPQYSGAKKWFRGVPLGVLFAKAPPTGGADLALLHFQNGMLIPVHFRSADELKKLDVFVAVAIADQAPDKGGAFSETFPPSSKPEAMGRDRRPLQFEGNKMVVPSGWHPMVAPKASKTFSPWRFADALVAVEYVRELAWYGQFDYGAPTAAGLAVFKGRCQFCHGVEKVGANYGWDIVQPLPIYKHRNAKSLALHTRYREGDAAEKGLMMPAFPEITTPEVEAVWKWFEAAGTLERPRYTLTNP